MINEYYKEVLSDLKKINKDNPKIMEKLAHLEGLEPLGITDFCKMYNFEPFEAYGNTANEDSDFIFEYRIFADFIAVAFHYEGDIRGNYSDYFIFSIEDLAIEDLLVYDYEEE